MCASVLSKFIFLHAHTSPFSTIIFYLMDGIHVIDTSADCRHLRSASQGENLTPSPSDISSRVGPTTPPPPAFSPEPEVRFQRRTGGGGVS
jgi:hypothetical protein